jgi:hypothetical protein
MSDPTQPTVPTVLYLVESPSKRLANLFKEIVRDNDRRDSLDRVKVAVDDAQGRAQRGDDAAALEPPSLWNLWMGTDARQPAS